jgi:uncharacterized protein
VVDITLTWWALPLFFIVAALYSCVGHGGASGYLALFALLGAASAAIVPIALTLNVLVAGIGFFNYWRSGYFSPRLLLPFVVGSVPAAYVGGLVDLPRTIFAAVLGSALILAAVRMLFLREVRPVGSPQKPLSRWAISLVLGLVLGLVSGVVGIGGGIFLSPILLFLQWADAKRTAAVSSAFIVLNSLSGLAGHLSRGDVRLAPFLLVGATVLAGGMTGSYWGAWHVRPLLLQTLLGVVLLVAGIKLLLPMPL